MAHEPLSPECQGVSRCAAPLMPAGIQRQQLVLLLLPSLLAPGRRRMGLMPGKRLDAENNRQHARQPAKACLPEKHIDGVKRLFEERAALLGMEMPVDQQT